MLHKILASPDAIEQMTIDVREGVTTKLLHLLGKAFTNATHRNETMIRVKHLESGLEFTLVPGGVTEIGLRPDDVIEVAKHVDYDRVEYSIEVDSASALPLRSVNVTPFLCSCKPLNIGTVSRSEAFSKVTALGFRLPSEVELEWILRDGGRYALTLGAVPVVDKPGQFVFQPSRYGIEGLTIANWAADDWHPTYDGAPTTSSEWIDGDPAGVCRSAFPLPAMVSEEDIAVLLAALRTPGSQSMPAVARAVIDVPSE